MADKELKVRTQLKYDTLENWSGSTFILKRGEVAVVEVPTGSDVTTNPPAIVFKVGDGEKTFSDLPYASGLAADVYAWAKEATKPSYSYEEIEGLSDDITQEASDLVTKAVQELLESEDFENAVIQDVTSTVETAVKEAEEYTDKAIETLAPDNSEGGDYITAITIQDGKMILTKASLPSMSEYATIEYVETALEDKQDVLEFDDTPTEDSDNPVTSSGIKKAIDDAISTLEEEVDNELSSYAKKEDVTEEIEESASKTLESAKSYTDEVIEGVTQFDIKVVDELPEVGEKGIIYLLKHEHSEDDIYDEYIWDDETQTYEKIGNTDVDLKDYVTTEEMTEAIENATEEVTSTLEDYADSVKEDIEEELQDYVKTGVLEDYLTRDEAEETYATFDDVSDALLDLGEVTAEEGKYVSGVGISDEGELYIEQKELPEVNLEDYYTKEETDDAIKNAIEDLPEATTYGVETGDGLKVTKTEESNATTFKVEIDSETVFVLNCGSATDNID